MRFYAEMRYEKEKDVVAFTCAFLEEFNVESSIESDGKEVKVELVFDQKPSPRIIKEIEKSKAIKFKYGRNLLQDIAEEIEKSEAKEVDEIPEQSEIEEAEEEISNRFENEEAEENIPNKLEEGELEKEIPKQLEEGEKKKEGQKKGSREARRIRNNIPSQIPQLTEIAKNSKTFEDFVNSVVECIGLKQKKEFFDNLIKVACEIEKISWKEIEKVFETKKFVYSNWDKIWCNRKIKEKLNTEEYKITILELIKLIVTYKQLYFPNEGKEQISEEAGEVELTDEATMDEKEQSGEIRSKSEKIAESVLAEKNKPPKKRVKMVCMPEIPYFEEVLGTIDKTQPMEERVKYVLTRMGLEKISREYQDEILEIANVAIVEKRIDFNRFLLKARIRFSEFINNFAEQYGNSNFIKLEDFLQELRIIVRTENEIKELDESKE